jgi:hypothetical protein
VVQANSTLIEGESVSWIGKLVESDEGLTSDEPDSASKWPRLLVKDQLGVEDSLVPRDTAVEIADCQSHMGDYRGFGHVSLLVDGHVTTVLQAQTVHPFPPAYLRNPGGCHSPRPGEN